MTLNNSCCHAILAFMIGCLAFSATAYGQIIKPENIPSKPDIRPRLVGKSIDDITSKLGAPGRITEIGSVQFVPYRTRECVESTCQGTVECGLSLTVKKSDSIVADIKLYGEIIGLNQRGTERYNAELPRVCNSIFSMHLDKAGIP